MVESLNATHADLVQESPAHKNPVNELTRVQQSDHHPTFSQLGEIQVNQVEIKDGFLELPINQNAFVTEFLPTDYDKPNLEDLVNKITGLTESQRKRFLTMLIKNDRVFQESQGKYIGEPIKLKLRPHATPVWNKPYPPPLKHRAALKRELQH
jgi:hypothetical protein